MADYSPASKNGGLRDQVKYLLSLPESNVNRAALVKSIEALFHAQSSEDWAEYISHKCDGSTRVISERRGKDLKAFFKRFNQDVGNRPPGRQSPRIRPKRS